MHQLSFLLSQRTPPTEQRLFTFGVNDTLKGDFVLTRLSAQEIMARYREHGVDLMLDYEHHSLSADATPEQKKASGWGDLEVRDDGLYLVNIRWSPKAQEYLRNGEFRYLSPAFNVNDENEIIELINVALTNLPATNDQLPLVAASRRTLTKEHHMSKMMGHLKAAMGKHGGMDGLSKHLGWDGEKLSKHMGGEPMTHEEMKHCAMKLGLQESDLEDEDAPIDTSVNGIDVNKSKGNPTDGALGGLFELVGGEATVPTVNGEAPENQSGGLHMSRAELRQLIDDRKTIVELKQTIESAQREQIIAANRAKLTPRLVALAKRMPVKDMREFVDALPAPVELNEPKPEGVGRMVALTREDKEVAKLSGKTEKEFAEAKEAIGDERLIALAGNVGHAPDRAPKSNWDRKYADHFMTLSMTDRTPDGKPWRPAQGSAFKPASRLAHE
jgi:phage I-like protein